MNMEKPKRKCSLMLHPLWKQELPESFSILVRSDHFVDCTSYEIGSVYIEVEALEQNIQMGTVIILLPTRLVSAVVLSDSPSIIGFAPSELDTETENH